MDGYSLTFKYAVYLGPAEPYKQMMQLTKAPTCKKKKKIYIYNIFIYIF